MSLVAPRSAPRSSSIPFVVLSTMLALPLAAAAPQQPSVGKVVPASPTELRTVGLCHQDGQWLGIGPDYKVTFADEVQFTPALGRVAPHDLPLGYRLDAVGRGEATLPVVPVAPAAHADRVVYEHGATTARYTLRPDGVEQDFVFTQLPAGRGDLVVRGRVRTTLPVAFAAADRLDFAIDGIGGVRIGAVVGIDAAGQRAAGELRLLGDVLEYRLPAAFVDAATLPLVVDPLLGAITSITTINADTAPEVAYDVDSDTWLIVWSREFSASNSDIRGQRVLGTGALQGGLLSIESGGTTIALSPSVGNVAMRDAFVVAWWQSGSGGGTAPGIHARGVAGASGAMTAAVVVRSGGDFVLPVIGGEANETVDDDVLCAWTDTATPVAEWCQLSYTAVGTIGVFGTATIPSVAPRDSRLAISRSGGEVGRHLLAWATDGSSPTVRVLAVDRNQNLVTGITVLTAGTWSGFVNFTGDRFFPTGVDGDGSAWTVAWENENFNFSIFPLSSTMHAVPVLLTGGALRRPASAAVAFQAPTFNTSPSVCRVRESALLAWAAGPDLRLSSLDSYNCELCEGSYLVDTSTNDIGSTAMSWRGGPGAGDGEALLVWSATNPGGQIRFSRFRADDGTISQVESACDGGGRLGASCAFTSHPMRLQLQDAPPNAPSLLVFSLDRLDYSCGSCTLVPDPFAGFVTGVATTDPTGTRSFDLVLPSGASGRRFYAQYATAGTGCLSGFSLSSALSIRIQ